ncbi:hypothetical protein IAT40_003740 [Kwoniella sp. CBS 6097]
MATGSSSSSGTGNRIISSPFLNLKTIDSLLATSSVSSSASPCPIGERVSSDTGAEVETEERVKDVQNRIQLLSAKIHLLVNDLNLSFPPRPPPGPTTASIRGPTSEPNPNPNSQHDRSRSISALALTSGSNTTQAFGAVDNDNDKSKGKKERSDGADKKDSLKIGTETATESVAEIDHFDKELAVRDQRRVEKDKAVFKISQVRLELAKAYMTKHSTSTSITTAQPTQSNAPTIPTRGSTTTASITTAAKSQLTSAVILSAPDYISAEVELSLAEKDCRFILKRNDKPPPNRNRAQPNNDDDRDRTSSGSGQGYTDPNRPRLVHQLNNQYQSGGGGIQGDGTGTENWTWVGDVRQLRMQILRELVKVEEGLGRLGRAERWKKATTASAHGQVS